MVIIGAPYVAASGGYYAGVPMEDWIAAPKRVRQQSGALPVGPTSRTSTSTCFEHLRMVDYGDADIPASVMHDQSAENVLAAQAAVEAKVNDALRAGRGAGGNRAEQPLRELRDRQALRGARRRPLSAA